MPDFGMRDALRRLFSNTLHAKLARIERRSHGSRATYVGDNRVLVRCFVEKADILFYVEADDRLLSPWVIASGAYEPGLTRFFAAALKPDSRCIDVGANFGYFTCLMARLCPDGRTIGIEPNPRVFALARDNVIINGLAHATVINAAASDAAGELTLYRRSTRSGNTSIAPVDRDFTDLLGEDPIEPFTVASMRIDDRLAEFGGRVDFIKVDVEGAEPLVIAGAGETIAANPQLSIVMEWSPGQVRTAGFDIGDFLRDLDGKGLRPFAIDGRRPQRIAWDDLAGMDYQAGVLLRRGD